MKQGGLIIMLTTAFVFIILHVQVRSVEMHYVTEKIESNVGFYFRNLSLFPSKMATIGFSVYYIRTRSEPYAILNFYTTKEHVNVQKQCSEIHHGQFFNEKMYVALADRSNGHHDCKEVNDTVHCSGTIVIQDYLPRNYFFSFGFKCDSVGSLKGIEYNISILEATNTTKCSHITFRTPCSKHYSQFSLPNLQGLYHEGIIDYYNIQSFIYLIGDKFAETCYQYLEESICYLSFPKCEDNRLMPLCRETCSDLMNACLQKWLSVLEGVSPSQIRLYILKTKVEEHVEKRRIEEWWTPLCNYLPPKDGFIPCFYKPVTCEDPEKARNSVGQSDIISENHTYSLNSKLTYSCENETENDDNNYTVTCMYSGKWSKPPKCKPKVEIRSNSRNPLFVVVPVLAVPLVFITATWFVLRCRMNRKNIPLLRNKTFDAFVCYCYEDIDAQFAENTLRLELEENIDPPFKLCIHRRDFQAAWDIMWNINNAIKNSNSAIIVMSQDYVNSLWCKEEFEQCYMEHMKDPAFKLFVIMMQPADSLERTSLYMDSFFDQKTYLDRNDVKLFKKVSNYLSWVKEPNDGSSFTC